MTNGLKTVVNLSFAPMEVENPLYLFYHTLTGLLLDVVAHCPMGWHPSLIYDALSGLGNLPNPFLSDGLHPSLTYNALSGLIVQGKF
jgi:hypothetical protein